VYEQVLKQGDILLSGEFFRLCDQAKLISRYPTIAACSRIDDRCIASHV
jgi:hypothetical protein